MSEVDACPHCGDPCSCDEACVRDMRRQEEASDAILRITEARYRKMKTFLDGDCDMNEWVDDLLVGYLDLMTKAYKEGSDVPE